MMIFNVILAEESSLHLALIYKNMDQFEKHVNNKTMYLRQSRVESCMWHVVAEVQ
jgi:hypothetical protein